MLTGFVVFHSRLNSSIVFETETEQILAIDVTPMVIQRIINTTQLRHLQLATSIVQTWLSSGYFARSIMQENVSFNLKEITENNNKWRKSTCLWHKKTHTNKYPTRCNVTQFIYIWKLLYMFRVVSPPIIGAHNTVSAASGNCQTVTAACRFLCI